MSITAGIHIEAANVAEVERLGDGCWCVRLRPSRNSFGGVSIFVHDRAAAGALRNALDAAIAAERGEDQEPDPIEMQRAYDDYRAGIGRPQHEIDAELRDAGRGELVRRAW